MRAVPSGSYLSSRFFTGLPALPPAGSQTRTPYRATIAAARMTSKAMM